jgi:hypothetical protein
MRAPAPVTTHRAVTAPVDRGSPFCGFCRRSAVATLDGRCGVFSGGETVSEVLIRSLGRCVRFRRNCLRSPHPLDSGASLRSSLASLAAVLASAAVVERVRPSDFPPGPRFVSRSSSASHLPSRLRCSPRSARLRFSALARARRLALRAQPPARAHRTDVSSAPVTATRPGARGRPAGGPRDSGKGRADMLPVSRNRVGLKGAARSTKHGDASTAG